DAVRSGGREAGHGGSHAKGAAAIGRGRAQAQCAAAAVVGPTVEHEWHTLVGGEAGATDGNRRAGGSAGRGDLEGRPWGHDEATAGKVSARRAQGAEAMGAQGCKQGHDDLCAESAGAVSRNATQIESTAGAIVERTVEAQIHGLIRAEADTRDRDSRPART